MDTSHEAMGEKPQGLESSSPQSRYPDDSIMEGSPPFVLRPAPVSPIIENQPPQQTLDQEQVQHSSNVPLPILPATNQKGVPPSFNQHFATASAQHKFTIGMERISTLIDRYSTSAPEISLHLQTLKHCLSFPSLPLDDRRIGMGDESKAKDVDVDVEKSRVWKFRFLDLVIEMVTDEKGIGRKEVANVLMYVEAVLRDVRAEMDGKGKGGED